MPHTKARIEHSLANRLLAALGPADRQRLLADAHCVDLSESAVLDLGGTTLTHAYFPTTSIVSLHYVTESGASAETAGVGNGKRVTASLSPSHFTASAAP